MLAPKLANTAVLSKDAARANLSKETAEHYASVTMEHRLALHQFYTPKHLIEKMLETIDTPKDGKVLEPAYGSGDMLTVLLERGYTNITGVEIDPKLFTPEYIQKWTSLGVKIINADTLKYHHEEQFDLIFSNPPYGKYYAPIIDRMIDYTKSGGVLSFLIPTALMTNTSMAKYREKIHRTCNIERLYIHPNRKEFANAEIEVMILQLRKTTPTMDFCKMVNGKIVFVSKKNDETPAEAGSISKTVSDAPCDRLSDLITIVGGTIDVAEETKKAGSNTAKSGFIPLIYGPNIENGVLKLGTVDLKTRGGERFQYLSKTFKPTAILKSPFIAIKKLIGLRGKSFHCVLIKSGEYYAEKHTFICRAKNIQDLEKAYATLSDTKYMLENYVENYTSRWASTEMIKDVCIKK